MGYCKKLITNNSLFDLECSYCMRTNIYKEVNGERFCPWCWEERKDTIKEVKGNLKKEWEKIPKQYTSFLVPQFNIMRISVEYIVVSSPSKKYWYTIYFKDFINVNNMLCFRFLKDTCVSVYNNDIRREQIMSYYDFVKEFKFIEK